MPFEHQVSASFHCTHMGVSSPICLLRSSVGTSMLLLAWPMCGFMPRWLGERCAGAVDGWAQMHAVQLRDCLLHCRQLCCAHACSLASKQADCFERHCNECTLACVPSWRHLCACMCAFPAEGISLPRCRCRSRLSRIGSVTWEGCFIAGSTQEAIFLKAHGVQADTALQVQRAFLITQSAQKNSTVFF